MDNHERGLEKRHDRPDQPLPEWKGRYRGDPRKLPRVVQKLIQRRHLTAEEKAELLWRFYELDQENRARARRRLALLIAMGAVLVIAVVWVSIHPPEWFVQSVVDLLEPKTG